MNTLPKLAQVFAVRFGGRLTQRKLGQLVPVAGVAVGAGLNYKLLDDVMDAAYWSYRERFLLEKQGQSPSIFVPESVEVEGEPGDTESSIDVIEMLREVGIRLGDEIGSGAIESSLPPADDSAKSPPPN